MARGDVLLVAFPQSEHREQSGRRPAVAVQADATDQPMLIVVPVTSNRKALRFKFAVSLDPTEENGLDLPSVAMVFQMRSVDRKRILKKLGRLSEIDLQRLDQEIWKMLKP